MYTLEHEPSEYQRGIIDWINNGSGHAVVDAVAGSGKTTILVEAAHHIDEDGLFVAFNKHIAEELNERLTETPLGARTIHSVSYGVLAGMIGRLDVQKRKYTNIVREHVKQMSLPHDQRAETRKNLKKLVDMARLELVDPDDREGLLRLCAKHDLPPNGYLRELGSVLKQGRAIAEQSGEIDFNDMIYLPVYWNLHYKEFPFVMVDEAQDLNACQLEVALRSCADDGRMLFVGDRRQAIYGFCGADADSYSTIIERTDATRLPLSVTYRCPTRVVERLQRVVSHIEAAPNADEGSVAYWRESQFVDRVRPGDLVLSRTNAPLIRRCIELVRKQIPARIRGRDVSYKLTDILDEVSDDPGFSYDDLIPALHTYHSDRKEYLKAKDASKAQFRALDDRVQCIEACYEGFDAASITMLKHEIKGLFSDDEEGVYFSSVHRAKGLENDRVIIIEPDKLPLEWPGQKAWQFKQERNLLYVAESRTKRELVICS
jgi:superfamily I DNA/RNA helicase